MKKELLQGIVETIIKTVDLSLKMPGVSQLTTKGWLS